MVRPPSPTLVEDKELVMGIQEDKAQHRKHTVGHSGVEDAVKAMEEYEKHEEIDKIKKSGRKRAHTVMHRSMDDAMTSFVMKKKKEEEEGEGEGDEDEDDDSSEASNDEDENFEDEEGKGGDGARRQRMPNIDSEEEPKEPEIISEEILYQDLKLLLHRQKMFTDPLGNELSLTISTYLIPIDDASQFSRFRIKAYDSVVGREMCMDVGEIELRRSLKHDPKSFTYNETDEEFHEQVLDRLKLVPTHDLNHDGFVNADDVVREDLNLALMEMENFTPLKMSIEVGPKAVEKKRKAMEEEERRKAERESLLLDYKMHSERLKFKERARQRSISAGEGVDLFGMSEADELVLKDSEREVGAEEIDASVTEAGA